MEFPRLRYCRGRHDQGFVGVSERWRVVKDSVSLILGIARELGRTNIIC